MQTSFTLFSIGPPLDVILPACSTPSATRSGSLSCMTRFAGRQGTLWICVGIICVGRSNSHPPKTSDALDSSMYFTSSRYLAKRSREATSRYDLPYFDDSLLSLVTRKRCRRPSRTTRTSSQSPMRTQQHPLSSQSHLVTSPAPFLENYPLLNLVDGLFSPQATSRAPEKSTTPRRPTLPQHLQMTAIGEYRDSVGCPTCR